MSRIRVNPTKPSERRKPAEVLESISAGAGEVKEVAAALTEKILIFEAYLSSVRGRVEAACWCKHPDDIDEQRTLFLKFLKLKAEWQIYWIRLSDLEEDVETEMKPLIAASLRIKIAAVDAFPDLLESIEENQRELINQVKEATDRLNKYIETLPKKEGK
jgi:hypothetical protein